MKLIITPQQENLQLRLCVELIQHGESVHAPLTFTCSQAMKIKPCVNCGRNYSMCLERNKCMNMRITARIDSR